jgi:hypothetical protein
MENGGTLVLGRTVASRRQRAIAKPTKSLAVRRIIGADQLRYRAHLPFCYWLYLYFDVLSWWCRLVSFLSFDLELDKLMVARVQAGRTF